jgi:hypothetical protein
MTDHVQDTPAGEAAQGPGEHPSGPDAASPDRGFGSPVSVPAESSTTRDEGNRSGSGSGGEGERELEDDGSGGRGSR